MKSLSPLAFIFLAAVGPLQAGTVVVTSLPGEDTSARPIRSLTGLPLGTEATIQLGAFPGMSDDQVLDLATTGLPALISACIPFGAAHVMGSGAGGQQGAFEIAVQQEAPEEASALVGEEISVVVRNGDEFLVLRFKDKTFAADTETGLGDTAILSLADAKIIVGNPLGAQDLATAVTPAVGSYDAWINGFAGITDEALRLPGADADYDGISNFMEYATGGDPSLPTDGGLCRIFSDESGDPWLRFRRQPGLGGVDLDLESSPDLNVWSGFEPPLEWDPSPPDAKSWLRTRLPDERPAAWFFRLDLPEGE
jgi:hypothetical protein